MNLSKLQDEVSEWTAYNFPCQPSYYPLLGAVGELGELAHATLKEKQGIRGTKEEHEAAAKDAVADVIIYLAHYCDIRDWDMGQVVRETWEKVKNRDWQKDKESGGTGE